MINAARWGSLALAMLPLCASAQAETIVQSNPSPGVEALQLRVSYLSAPIAALAPDVAAPPAPASRQGVAHLVQSLMESQADATDDVQCMAKVVYHEARHQSVLSQLAIAEVIANRARSGLFPRSLCKVVNQPGQFFPTGPYRVPTASQEWRTAVAIAQLAQTEARSLVAAGALFYHAAWTTPSWTHHKIRVAQIEGNIYYR